MDTVASLIQSRVESQENLLVFDLDRDLNELSLNKGGAFMPRALDLRSATLALPKRPRRLKVMPSIIQPRESFGAALTAA